jgi:hypothetical protein
MNSLRVLVYADIPIRLPKTGVARRLSDVLDRPSSHDRGVVAVEFTLKDDEPRPNHNDSIKAHHMSLYGVSVTNFILLQWD